MNAKSHASAWAPEAPTPAQLKEFFSQINAGKITKNTLQNFLRGGGHSTVEQGRERSACAECAARTRIGLCIPVDGTMSSHDCFSSTDAEIGFWSELNTPSTRAGIATYTLDEFTKILGYMTAIWGIPRESAFARLLTGIRETSPSYLRNSQRVLYDVSPDLYSGAYFTRGPGLHMW